MKDKKGVLVSLLLKTGGSQTCASEPTVELVETQDDWIPPAQILEAELENP